MKNFHIRHWFILVLIVAALIINCVFFIRSQHLSWQNPVKPYNPRLWFDKKQLKTIRADIQQHSWMNDFFQAAKKQTDQIIDEPIIIPEDGGVRNNELFPQGQIIKILEPGKYYSEAEDKIYTGQTVARGQGTTLLHHFPFKQHFDYNQHGVLASQTKLLGFIYAISQEKKYAQKASEILIGYARNFNQNKYPLHKYDGSVYEPDKTPPFAGRVTIDAVEDAYWSYDMMCAYDWILNSGFLNQSEQILIDKMFQIEYETIMRELASADYKNNHTTGENLARMAYGILTGDTAIIQEAVSGPMGFIDHLDSAMNSEGRTDPYGIGYHFAFLHAMFYTAEIYQRASYGNLFAYNDNKLKQGIDFIINSTYLDGLRLPQIQNADPVWNWTPAFLSIFESAYTHYQDENYLIPILDELKFLTPEEKKTHQAQWGKKLIRGTYTSMAGARTYVEGFLSAQPSIPEKPPLISLKSVHFPESKYIFLRQGNSQNGISAFITYQNQRVNHSDIMGFQAFALGQEIAKESGMATGYESKDYGAWFSQRVAHNTVVIDQYSPGLPRNLQAVAPLAGSLGSAQVALFEDRADSPRAVLTADGTVYPQVNMRRDISLQEQQVKIIDTLNSPQNHTYDWVFRNPGQITDISGVQLASWDSQLGSDFGYQKEYLFNIRRGTTNSKVSITWQAPDNPYQESKTAMSLTIEPWPNTEIILADAYWEKRSSIGPILLVRRREKNTSYQITLKPHYLE